MWDKGGNVRRLLGQIAGFGVVGIVATLIDFGVLAFLKEMFGIDPVLAAGVSFTVSLLFNYWASMRFVFTRRDDMSRARELTAFAALSFVGLALNELIMWLGVTFAGIHYLLVKVGATALVMVWNFWSRRRWLDAGE